MKRLMRRLKRSLAFLLTAVLLAALVPSAALAWTGPDVTVPEGHELVCFVDCGASTFPEEIQTLMAEYPDSVKNTTPDQVYTTKSGWVAETMYPAFDQPESTVAKRGVAFLVEGEPGPAAPDATNCTDFYLTVYGSSTQSESTVCGQTIEQ